MGYDEAQAGVPRLPDFTHFPRADWCEDFIRTEFSSRSEFHFFNPAVQLVTMVMGEALHLSAVIFFRNRWSSGATAHCFIKMV